MYYLHMLIPDALEHPPRTWVFPTAGRERCTTVYEKPVTIRELADQLGVSMSFLHRKVRSGHLPGFTVGDQTCVTPNIAKQVTDWYATNRRRWWPVFTDPASPRDDAASPET